MVPHRRARRLQACRHRPSRHIFRTREAAGHRKGPRHRRLQLHSQQAQGPHLQDQGGPRSQPDRGTPIPPATRARGVLQVKEYLDRGVLATGEQPNRGAKGGGRRRGEGAGKPAGSQCRPARPLMGRSERHCCPEQECYPEPDRVELEGGEALG